MRKITESAYNAFINKRNFQSKNTEVKIVDNECYLYLFDNLIAKTLENNLYICDGGYGTSRTTKERLSKFSELKIGFIKNQWFIENKNWDGKWLNLTEYEKII